MDFEDHFKLAVEKTREAADADTSDGGTCNFDSCAIKIKESTKLEEVFAKYGISYSRSASRWWKGYYILGVPCGGQARMRTAQAETMAQVLETFGYETTVYYQMD